MSWSSWKGHQIQTLPELSLEAEQNIWDGKDFNDHISLGYPEKQKQYAYVYSRVHERVYIYACAYTIMEAKICSWQAEDPGELIGEPVVLLPVPVQRQ